MTTGETAADELWRYLARARRALNKALKSIGETDVDALRAWPDMHGSLVRQIDNVISDAEAIRLTLDLSRQPPDSGAVGGPETD